MATNLRLQMALACGAALLALGAEGREAVRRAWPHIARELSRAAERRAGP